MKDGLIEPSFTGLVEVGPSTARSDFNVAPAGPNADPDYVYGVSLRGDGVFTLGAPNFEIIPLNDAQLAALNFNPAIDGYRVKGEGIDSDMDGKDVRSFSGTNVSGRGTYLTSTRRTLRGGKGSDIMAALAAGRSIPELGSGQRDVLSTQALTTMNDNDSFVVSQIGGTYFAWQVNDNRVGTPIKGTNLYISGGYHVIAPRGMAQDITANGGTGLVSVDAPHGHVVSAALGPNGFRTFTGQQLKVIDANGKYLASQPKPPPQPLGTSVDPGPPLPGGGVRPESAAGDGTVKEVIVPMDFSPGGSERRTLMLVADRGRNAAGEQLYGIRFAVPGQSAYLGSMNGETVYTDSKLRNTVFKVPPGQLKVDIMDKDATAPITLFTPMPDETKIDFETQSTRAVVFTAKPGIDPATGQPGFVPNDEANAAWAKARQHRAQINGDNQAADAHLKAERDAREQAAARDRLRRAALRSDLMAQRGTNPLAGRVLAAMGSSNPDISAQGERQAMAMYRGNLGDLPLPGGPPIRPGAAAGPGQPGGTGGGGPAVGPGPGAGSGVAGGPSISPGRR